MIKGHTKFSPDRHFGTIKASSKNEDILNFEQMFDSYGKEVNS